MLFTLSYSIAIIQNFIHRGRACHARSACFLRGMVKIFMSGSFTKSRTWLFSSIFLFFCAVFLYGSSRWVTVTFGGKVHADALMFFLATPKDGVDRYLVLSYLYRAAQILLATGIYAFLMYRFFRMLGGGVASDKSSSWLSRIEGRFMGMAYGLSFVRKFYTFQFFLVLACLVVANIYVLKKHRIFGLLKPKQKTTMYEEHYRSPAVGEVKFIKKNNVIVLMLESVEQSFNNERVFGEKLMPRLQAVRDENVSFYGHVNTPGATWTAGALTAYMFGLPLNVPLGRNRYQNVSDSFMPSATPIFGVFAAHGYDVGFFLGSNKEYAGQGMMFETHLAKKSVYDIDFFLGAAGPEKMRRRMGWGMPDAQLFDEVKKHLLGRKQDAPFFMVVQTLDTHTPGYFRGSVPARWGDKYLDSLAESDAVVTDFVQWLSEQDFASDTTIILVGDHLTMDPPVSARLDKAGSQREVFNVFINPAVKTGKRTYQRKFASFDMAPTILESAGAVLPEGRFGLGVSLFRQEIPTLFEAKSPGYYEAEYEKHSDFYYAFFRAPAKEVIGRW